MRIRKTQYWIFVPLLVASVYAGYERGWKSRAFWATYRFLLPAPPIWDATPEQEAVVRNALQTLQPTVVDAVRAITITDHLPESGTLEERAIYEQGRAGAYCASSGEIFCKPAYVSAQVIFHECAHAATHAIPEEQGFALCWRAACPEKRYIGDKWEEKDEERAQQEGFLEARAAMSLDEDVAIFGQELFLLLSDVNAYTGPLLRVNKKAPHWGKMADVFLKFGLISVAQRAIFEKRFLK